MRQEDSGLSEVNYGPLNAEFYRANPHEYFVRRLNSLILQAGRPDDLDRLMREGIEYRTLTVGPAADTEHQDQDADDLETYLALEAEILYHHSIETLLRLYLAHESSPTCQWLELARLRGPADFKERVEERFLSDQLSKAEKWERLHPVLVGAPAESLPHGEEQLIRVMDALESAMTTFASDFFGGANRYNAAKHGMAVRAEEQALRVGEGGRLSAQGIAIDYLEAKGQPKRWHRTTAWVDTDMRMGLTRIAAYLIQAVWEIAKKRYTDSIGTAQVYLLDKDLSDLVSRGRPWSLDSFSFSLIYEHHDGTYMERTGNLVTSVFNNPMPEQWRRESQE